MPELPEIETICQALKPKILNQIITEVKKLTNLKLRQAIPIDIEEKLKNNKVINVSRRAKYININLDNDISILIHLGMSGKILIKDKNYLYQKHDHFAICFKNDEQLVYNDPRRFGLIALCDTDKLDNNPLFKHLGIEPLSLEFTAEYLANILRNKRQPVKLSIMDNKNIVGVGNIYAVESLFLSKVSPTRPSVSLTKDEISQLRNNIVYVLEQSIKQGGSSIKDYASVSGENGYFQNFFKVYGRAGKDCLTCGEVIVKIKQAGRASFYCPTCQK